MEHLMRYVKPNVMMTAQHAAHLDDLENRMRRNNVQAIGIPERSGGENRIAFIESWLLTMFGKKSFTPMFSVERAHRVPMCPLPLDHPSRTFLFKLFKTEM